jgi:GNAT superfamily N-acetyltransferase
MVDMLVRLYSLPELPPILNKLKLTGFVIRRAHPAESGIIVSWVRDHFHEKWAAECQASLEPRPTTCFIATELQPQPEQNNDPYTLQPERLVGFACYDTIAKGMFGPEAVHPDFQGRGIGKALLLASMHAMSDDGYACAVIAWAGPTDFYKRTVGARIIKDSEPGIFRGPLITD